VSSIHLATYRHISQFPYAGVKFAAVDALKRTNLKWTSIYTGLFLDYIIVNHPTHLRPNAQLVDVDKNVAGIPGTGNDPVHFTYSYDVAKYTAALLALETWEQNYYIAGDVKTWNEVVEIVERAKGVKFEVVYDPVENLKKGEVKEMLGQRQSGEALGGEKNKEVLRRIAVMFRLWFTEGLAADREGVSLNKVLPEIEPLTLEKAWAGYQAK
jgi:nucleoside-diphosphate-sugar epimerase